jgi:hypothetical protein
MIKLPGLGVKKNSVKYLRKYQTMKFDCLDSLLQNTEILLSAAGERKNDRYELPSPIMFEFTNPMARFSCIPENREWVAKSAAETLFTFSGMNTSDFIWEFRDWPDPRIESHYNPAALGSSLRFFGKGQDTVLDYHTSNSSRQTRIGFKDQILAASELLKEGIKKYDKNIILFFASRNTLTPVFQSWLYCRNAKLNIMTWAGYLDNSELIFNYVPTFSFLLQIISDLAGIEMGSVHFTVGCLYADKLSPPKFTRSTGYPIVNTGYFRYPSGGLTLRDLDTLMSIMIEFVSRLDENSLNRANPFEGDDRIQLWQDYANIFRVWKADKLGVKIAMPAFFHPQLQFIYKGGLL